MDKGMGTCKSKMPSRQNQRQGLLNKSQLFSKHTFPNVLSLTTAYIYTYRCVHNMNASINTYFSVQQWDAPQYHNTAQGVYKH